MALTIKQKEIFCGLNLSDNPDAHALQVQMAKELIIAFEQGGVEGAATDLWKSNHYREMAGMALIDAGSPIFRTKWFYFLSGNFTKARVTGLRINQVAAAVGHAFWNRLFSAFGLSYFGEIAFHFGVVFYSTVLKPVTETEAKLSYSERTQLRFRNVLDKDDRLPKLINALIWGPLNLAGFILLGPFALLLNLFGFGIDLGLIASFSAIDVHRQKKTGLAVDKEIRTRQIELSRLEEEQRQGKEINNDRLIVLQKEINAFEYSNILLKEQVEDTIDDSIYTFGLTVLIITGIAMSFFPPTMVLGAVITGAALVVTFAPVIKNFCEKVWNYFTKQPPPKTVGLDANPEPSEGNPLLDNKLSAQVQVENSYQKHFNFLIDNKVESTEEKGKNKLEPAPVTVTAAEIIGEERVDEKISSAVVEPTKYSPGNCLTQ